MTTMDPAPPAAPPPPVEEPPAGAKYISIERRTVADTVFLVDDVPFRSTMPKPTHWSIAWSDVMMTMFVLFLSMYVYKAADQDFLNRPALEIVGGDTAEALDSAEFSAINPPIVPLTPGVPLMTSGTIRKTETMDLRDVDIDSAFSSISDQTKVEKEIIEIPDDRVIPPQPEPGTEPDAVKDGEKGASQPTTGLSPTDTAIDRPDAFYDLYRKIRSAIAANNLTSMAKVDMIPGAMVRLTLAADSFFATGQGSLADGAQEMMAQLALSLQSAPYMINVVGHTDNVPMYSERYVSNWELSTARASAVARFLIEESGMNPNQFVVSGYGPYRPMVANSTADSRKQNRRVEIIISRRLPNRPATTQ